MLSVLKAVLTELGSKLEPGQQIALDAATIAALSNDTVTVSNPTADPETGLAKDSTSLDIKRGVTDYRKLIEWNASSQPIYVGLNAQASATTDATWTIQRITWDANGLPTDVQVLVGVWDNRATLGWS